jgi:hypothetical protein
METAVIFEYLIVESKLFDKKVQIIEQEMNELGNEGWEMVAACGVHGQTFVFKRMVPEAAPKRRLKATASVPASDLLEIRLENTCIASCSFRPTSASCVHGCQHEAVLGIEHCAGSLALVGGFSIHHEAAYVCRRRITRDAKLGRAEALRSPMLVMIDKGDAHEAHPASWAPFVVVGEGSVAK